MSSLLAKLGHYTHLLHYPEGVKGDPLFDDLAVLDLIDLESIDLGVITCGLDTQKLSLVRPPYRPASRDFVPLGDHTLDFDCCVWGRGLLRVKFTRRTASWALSRRTNARRSVIASPSVSRSPMFVVICAYSGLTAAVRLPIGDIRSTPETWTMYRRIMGEARAVGTAEGITLPEDIVNTALDTIETLEPELYSSLHYDMTHGKSMELDALNGAVVRRGRKHGVDVPMNEAVCGILRPWAIRNQRWTRRTHTT